MKSALLNSELATTYNASINSPNNDSGAVDGVLAPQEPAAAHAAAAAMMPGPRG